ncbi:MAG: hypothetical protein HRU17_02430 [Polyangiaceae bacterium]|nr:hypothetical protein [Polyangiaceae bacterium]
MTFTDGASPQVDVIGAPKVHGPMDLEIQFQGANPLCFSYSTNISASRVAASQIELPNQVPTVGVSNDTDAPRFVNVDRAFAAINDAKNDLDDAEYAATTNASLDSVWGACDSGAVFDAQRERVIGVAAYAAQELSPTGDWRMAIQRGKSVALRATRLARELEASVRDADREAAGRESELAAALRTEKRLAEQLKTSRSRALRLEHEQATRDLASAQRRAREAKLAATEKRNVVKLATAADVLNDHVDAVAKKLGELAADINRARSLLAQSPQSLKRHFAAGETVNVVIHRTRLNRGVAGDDPAQSFEVPQFETLEPVLFDFAVGPALGVGRHTESYGLAYFPGEPDAQNPDARSRVIRDEQGLNLDMMVSVSAFVWKQRYLDDGIYDPWQLIPRPMVGVSLLHPTERLYLGLSVDPIQFLNISGGVRIGTEERLIGPQVGDVALLNSEGEAQAPVTRDETRAMGFVSITVSNNLIYRWFQQAD